MTSRNTPLTSAAAIRYDSIGLPDSLVVAAVSPYASDPAYQASAANRVVLNACSIFVTAAASFSSNATIGVSVPIGVSAL